MRRTYAFESDCPENVKAELEKVEAAVDENCASSDDCDEVLAKIDGQAEKFDDALKSMANAAKDAKAGGDQAAATASIEEAQADLKQVAKTIGVANESDSEYADRTEIEDVKAYLEGAREIVEAKKDELSDGGCEGGECDDDANEACEAWLDAYSDALADALESEIYDGIAMEGATSDGAAIFWSKHKELNAMKKEMNAAAKSGDYKTAAAKARECANIGGEMESAINSLPQDLKASVIVKIAMAVAAALASAAVGGVLGRFSKGGKAAASNLATSSLSYKHNKSDTLKAQVKGDRKALGKQIGKGAGIVGGGAGAVTGAAAAASFLRKKKVVDENGNTHSELLAPNEHNTVLNLIKADAKRIKAAFTKKAEAFEAKASEAPAVDATESFISTMESLMISGKEETLAVESEGADAYGEFADMVAAYESELGLADMSEEDAEAAIDSACEAAILDLKGDIYDMAMEGVNTDATVVYNEGMTKASKLKKEMLDAAKAKDFKTAAAKAREAAAACDEIKKGLSQIPVTTKDNVLAHAQRALTALVVGLAFAAGAAGAEAIGGGGKKMAAAAGIGSAIGGTAGVSSVNGIAQMAAKHNVKKEKKAEAKANTPEGEKTPKVNLNANDRNAFINNLRNLCDNAKRAFLKAAKKYDKKAKGQPDDEGEGGGVPAAESWLLA